MRYKQIIKKSLILIGSTLVLSSSLINIFEKKGDFKSFVKNYTDKFVNLITNNSKENNLAIKKILKPDEYWGYELRKGGYILYMRHAKRDKWEDVAIYDAAEAKLFKENRNEKIYGENKYYAGGVCLSEKGKIQAKMFNEKIKESKVPIGFVVSSPSCRARQTATLAFGRYDSLDEQFIHRNVFNEVYDEWQVKLKETILNLPLKKGSNTLITAHGGVINRNMFINKDVSSPFTLKQGGFYVISKNNGKLKMEHEFSKFEDFSKVFANR